MSNLGGLPVKTPDEIKRGLEMCHCDYEDCEICSFADLCEEKAQGRAYIQQLERENAQKDERIQQLERERDAAVYYIAMKKECRTCKHFSQKESDEPCRSCGIGQSHWEWRGVEEDDRGKEEL